MVFKKNNMPVISYSKLRDCSILIIYLGFGCLLWSCKSRAENNKDLCNENSIKSKINNVIYNKIQEIEKVLLDKEQDWFTAYRALVKEGKPGWEVICKHCFDLIEETEHLRKSIDLGGLPKEILDGFCEFYDKQETIKIENEEWAMRYAQSLMENAHGGMLSWPPEEYYILKGNVDTPKEARLTIAVLRYLLEKDFGYPWNGHKEKQQKAIKAWLKYIESMKNPWGEEEFENERSPDDAKELVKNAKDENIPDDCIALHTVKEGDYLAGISEKYYGTPKYWRIILEVNPKIGKPRSIKVGMILKIPKLE